MIQVEHDQYTNILKEKILDVLFQGHDVLCLRNENNITFILLLQDADALLV